MRKNCSINGESINLKLQENYVIMDALYADDLRLFLTDYENNPSYDFIRKECFPYTPNPFGVCEIKKNQLELKNIVKAEDIHCCVFDTDTSLILFINKRIFFEVVKEINYECLTDSFTETINFDEWNRLHELFPNNDIALICSPGLDYVFGGSGSYSVFF